VTFSYGTWDEPRFGRTDNDLAPCPTCGPVATRPWHHAGHWRVVRCPLCGLGITWPRPTKLELDSFYGEGYYTEHGMDDQAAGAWLERAAALLALLPVHPRRVLDIGAGQGHFVASLRRLGFEAEGVEPLSFGRNAAKRIHGIALHPTLPDSGSFDVVTLIHSLEHVSDPLATLQAAARRLSEDGRLLIELPHVDSVEMFRSTRRRHILSLPGHLHHFTPGSLEALLQKASMKSGFVHLRNPDALEWLLTRWADLKRLVKARTAAADATPANSERGARSSRRENSLSLWRESVLPFLRSRFPGWSFAVVAHRAVELRVVNGR
jgi:SAM-dependent methyltransferase